MIKSWLVFYTNFLLCLQIDKIYDISFVQEDNKTKVYTITKELENHPTIVETPKTGDESHLKLWISLFVVSFIIIAILIYKFLKKLYIK